MTIRRMSAGSAKKYMKERNEGWGRRLEVRVSAIQVRACKSDVMLGSDMSGLGSCV